MTKKLNEIAIKIAKSCELEYGLIKDDPVEICFGKDDNGEVGIASDGNELTVYGCGGHRHYMSDDQFQCDQEFEMMEMKEIITGILNGKWCCWGAYTKNDVPVCGSLERIEEINLPEILARSGSSYLIVNVFNKPSYKLEITA
jgi:hypothetical protein